MNITYNVEDGSNLTLSLETRDGTVNILIKNGHITNMGIATENPVVEPKKFEIDFSKFSSHKAMNNRLKWAWENRKVLRVITTPATMRSFVDNHGRKEAIEKLCLNKFIGIKGAIFIINEFCAKI